MSRDLFFGPTDQREVIIEFLFTRMVTDIHGSLSYHEFANCRIFLYHTENRRMSRVTNLRIIELIFTRSSTEHHGFIYLVMNSQIR